jgi:Ca2+/Na+ antiporter
LIGEKPFVELLPRIGRFGKPARPRFAHHHTDRFFPPRPQAAPCVASHGTASAMTDMSGARRYVPLQDRLKSADEVKLEWDNLLVYRNIAIGAAGGVLVLGNVIKAYYDGLLTGSFNYYVFGALLVRIGLIVVTLLWIQSGTVEHGYLMRWIRTPLLRSRRPVQVMLSFFLLAGFFAVLMLIADRVHLLFLFYSVFLLIDIATVKLRRDEIGAAIESGQRFLRSAVAPQADGTGLEQIERDRAMAELYDRALGVLRSYYFNRHHITRIVVTLAVMGTLCVAAYALPRGAFGLVPVDTSAETLSLMGYAVPFDIARFVGYVLFLLVLFSSELVVAHWRSTMRDELYDVRDALFELG